MKKCLEQNQKRERVVPEDVIKRMYMNWNTPYWFEGWDAIFIDYQKEVHDFKEVDKWIDQYNTYNQDNPHHEMTLGKHCLTVGGELVNEDILFFAGALHDCGKPFTKTFVNSKGETTDVAHYYQHHCVGAYDSLFFQYPDEIDALDVSILINLHMMPYDWERNKEHGERTKIKYQRLWGRELYNNIMKLHAADVVAH